MPRQARVVIEGVAHHVIQRGNRRQQVFFTDEDRRFYLAMLTNLCRTFRTSVWAYCLMDNHVHLVLVPADREGMTRALAETHKHYTQRINERNGWRGYLWQGRYLSCVLSESHLFAAVRYVERNPVRAGLVTRPEKYPWSSARAHILGDRDPLLSYCPLVGVVRDWREYLGSEQEDEVQALRQQIFGKVGRPKKGTLPFSFLPDGNF